MPLGQTGRTSTCFKFNDHPNCQIPRALIIPNPMMQQMKSSHIAVNVADPAAVTSWYQIHCGLRVIRQRQPRSQLQLLMDASGSNVLEIHGKTDNVPDYRKMDPWSFHSTLASNEPFSDSQRLVAAGAVFVSECHLHNGSHFVMLRDPWGLALLLFRSSRHSPAPPGQKAVPGGRNVRLGRASREESRGGQEPFAPNGAARDFRP